MEIRTRGVIFFVVLLSRLEVAPLLDRTVFTSFFFLLTANAPPEHGQFLSTSAKKRHLRGPNDPIPYYSLH